MTPKNCLDLAEMAFPIALIQNGVNRFTVKYGLQIKAKLTYSEAASELGACIMHALACDGKLDNREKGE
jgi:hypothetical protein